MQREDSERRVWRHLNQTNLDLQYSPSKWCVRPCAPHVVETHIDKIKQGSLLARSSCLGTCQLNIKYSDTSPNASLDIYLPQNVKDDTLLFVYIHGGYWSCLHKDDSAWFADSIRKVGGIYVAVNYDLCPDVTLDTIVEQIRLSIVFLASHFNNRQMILGGHSAGAHLCAMAISTDWDRYDLPAEIIRNVFLFSGIYDLVPVQLSCNNQTIGLDKRGAVINSPLQWIDRISSEIKIHVLVGEHDSPEFKRQSREYRDALAATKKDVIFHLIPQVDHFDLMERLCESGYFPTRLIQQTITRNQKQTEDPKSKANAIGQQQTEGPESNVQEFSHY